MSDIFLKILIIAMLVGFGLIIAKEVGYYMKGWGLNFHILDIKQQDAWVKPFPNKIERIWLLVTIIFEIALLLAIALPAILFLSSN